MKKFFDSKKLAKLGIFSALSFLLYNLNFSLAFIFPSFLKIDLGDFPVLIGAFSMGPVHGILILAVRTLLKLPFSETNTVGEWADFMLGCAFIIPAALIYKFKRNKKYAIVGMIIGSLICTTTAMVLNRVLLVPFYTELYAKGNFDIIVGACSTALPSITADNFYTYYLFGAVLPFNLLKTGVISLITILSYKRISGFINKGLSIENFSDNHSTGRLISNSAEETLKIAESYAKTLNRGDIVLLVGELGAGKTAFAKGVAAGLGIRDNVTSPTYSYMNDYNGLLYHYDCYRLESGEQARALGLTDYFDANGICLIEWAENIKSVLPQNVKTVNITVINENTRGIEL